MEKTTGIVLGVLALAIIVGGVFYLNRKSDTVTSDNLTAAEQNQNTNYTGRVVFSVTDAAADMSTISEINMRINSVDVHSTTEGWVTVSTTPQTFSLLMLKAKNVSQLLADTNIKTGTYDQVRLIVDSVAIKTKAGTIKVGKLPSNELKLNVVVTVNADKTSSVNFDFLASESLHITGNGVYIFAPVVKTITKSNASVNVDVNHEVQITGGTDNHENTQGMDIDGNVKMNFHIDSKVKLDIDTENKIKILLK